MYYSASWQTANERKKFFSPAHNAGNYHYQLFMSSIHLWVKLLIHHCTHFLHILLQILISIRCYPLTQLSCFIIPWKYMMVIMPSFSQSSNGHGEIFNWTNKSTKSTNFKLAESKAYSFVLIVWLLTPHVGNAINEKRNVQCDAKACVKIDPKRVP